MKEEKLSTKVAKSLLWKFFERGGVQVVQFVVAILIARLLGPGEYGSVALLMVFISIATVFVQSGLNTALIQKKDVDEIDRASVFFGTLAVALIFYILLFFTAGPIANFYEIPKLKNMLRVLALILFPGAFNSIHVAILSKTLQFKKQFYSSFLAVILSGALGLGMAILGYGAWALIFQQLSYQFFICIFLGITLRWRPQLVFSIKRVKRLLGFGGKLFLAKIIDTLYHNLESLIIGKKYSSDMLAYCDKGKKFPLTLIDNIDGAIQSVLLPAYASQQDDQSEVKRMLRRAVSMSTYLSFPAMIGLACVARPLVFLVLGSEWEIAVPFLQLYCIISMLFPLQTASLQAINAMGYSGVYLSLMIVKRVLGILILSVVVFCADSIYLIVIACLLAELIGVIINFFPNKKILNYTIREQIVDILPNLFQAIGMGIAVSCIPNVFAGVGNINSMYYILLLAIQCFAGVILYFTLSIIFRNKSFNYIKEKIKKRKK